MNNKFRFRMESLTLLLLLFGFAECKFKIQIKMLVSSSTLDPKDFKPGVSIDPQPESVFYNKYIPLIFQLKVPDFSPEAIRLNSSLHCMSDSVTPNYLCPVAFHFERLLGPLADNMKFSKNVYTPMVGWPYFGEIRCNAIESHFQHISTNINELHLYTDKLSSECALARNITIISRNITSGASNHLVLANNKFSSAFLSSTKNGTTSDEYKLAQMAGYVGLQASYILTKYIDTIRWSNAFTSCQNYKLNINLIHSYLLQTSLSQIRSIAEANGLKLSIQSHDHLLHYYKLPVVDCILGVQNTKKSTLMIRVAVPVMKKNSKYTRIKITKIPYLVADSDGSNKQICEIDNFEPNEEFLLEENALDSSRVITNIVDCFEGELCFVPETPRKPLIDQCLKGLINGSVDDIRDYCSFSCYEVEHDQVFPIIIKIDSNHYSITGSPPTTPVNGKIDNIQLYCDNIYKKNLSPNATNGVLQVVLPCNCEIRFRSNTYKAYKPCESPLEIHYLNTIPFHAIYLDEESLAMFGGSERNNSSNSSVTEKINAAEKNSENNEEDVDGPIAAKSTHNHDDHGHSHTHTSCKQHTTQLGFIWVFIVLLLLSNFILIYVAYCNRLIQMDLITGWFSGWGFTSSPPISRLREDHTVVMSQQQNHDNFTQPPWPTPAALNRL